MSMYCELLVAALEMVERSDVEPATSVALVDALRCRDRLTMNSAAPAASGSHDAVVDDLAYDVALIELARRLGIRCDVVTFDQRHRARARLEGALAARGIDLDHLGQSSAT